VERKLTIVVGAGASSEFGLPAGSGLKTQIAKILDIRFGADGQKSGDDLVAGALKIEAHRQGLSSINDLLPHAWHIVTAMPQAASIDNFIDTHQDNKAIEICGKVAIIKAILDAERRSKLYLSLDNDANRRSLHERVAGTWISALFMRLVESCRVKELGRRLGEVSFVIFNYDRCVEHYLFYALRNYYSMSTHEAAELLSHVRFFHPYGTLGRLPWQTTSRQPYVEFGCELAAGLLLDSTKNIKTFTEGTDPEASNILEIKGEIANSVTALFLGFAFHRLNLQLLKPSKIDEATRAERVSFGTAVGISDQDVKEIMDEVAAVRGASVVNTYVRNDLDCSKIFAEFARKISFV